MTYVSQLIASQNPLSEELKLARSIALDANHAAKIEAGVVPGSGILYRGLAGPRIDSGFGHPTEYILWQNYPNPFTPPTTIRYGLLRASTVQLTVLIMLGQQVALLVDGGQGAGYHEVKFDASNVASGVYFYLLQVGDFVSTKKFPLHG